MEIAINNKMKQLTMLFFLILFFSCKQESKINVPEIKEGYYEFEILEKYYYPPDSTNYLSAASSRAQIYTKPGFLIKKTSTNNTYTACVTYKNYNINTGCNPFNCSIEIIFRSKDSIFFQRPPCYIDGSYDGFVPHRENGPISFVDSTLKYQPLLYNLNLTNEQEIIGNWSELIKCYYINFETRSLDSIVDKPILAKFKLKYVKGI
jgi:hypothetical protein